MPLFSWSTPSRYNGKERLPLIPNEVYFQIFSYLPQERIGTSPIGTFSSLSKVCRFFCAYFLAELYKELHLDCAQPHKQHINLCRLLMKGDKAAVVAASYVKDCTIRITVRDSTPQQRVWLTMFLSALRHMSNLRELTLAGLELNLKTLSGVFNLPKLERLILHWPKWDDDTVLSLESLQRISTPKLEIAGNFGDLSLEPSTLRSLISTLQLTRVDCLMWYELEDLLQLQVDGSISLQLRALKVAVVSDVHLFQTFLAKTPTLEEIQFMAVIPSVAPPEGTFTPIPRLNLLRCPSVWFNFLLGGTSPRKLSVLTVAYHSFPPKGSTQITESELAWINRSDIHAKKLVLPEDWANTVSFAKIISRCHTFGLVFGPDTNNLDLDNIGGKETTFPNITSILILPGRQRPSESKIPFSQITRKFPQALSLEIDEIGEWVRPPDAVDEWRKTEGESCCVLTV